MRCIRARRENVASDILFYVWGGKDGRYEIQTGFKKQEQQMRGGRVSSRGLPSFVFAVVKF
jgi:hypothetical protein